MTEKFIRAADEAVRSAYEEPMTLAEYVEAAMESPSIAAHASKYLLNAIASMETRTVIEEGEERERYRFFDDPHNDGEHAILGNTAVLNAFVDDLRTIAADRGKAEKLLWFDGPTATGKSELKRCLINGLREYSKTEAGRRYTLEWNISGTDGNSLSYGIEATDDDEWYRSPVQTHPLSVFPRSVRESIVEDINDTSADSVPIRVESELDPFSREAYSYLEDRYRKEGRRDLFSAITDESHLRVTNYVVDTGRGIGILHAEDDGSPKERLVGSWMPGMLRELDSRGRKNPQAFSYDGVLSQGNGLLTIVEDASQHADLLRKLLNVPDDRRVKLDKGIGMDIDSQLIIISNPDLDVELDQFSDRNGHDPLKALKRRLDRHEFRYLTNRRLETELIYRELTGETTVWGQLEPETVDQKVRTAIEIPVRGQDGVVRTRELAPHTISAAAMYSVVTRLDADSLPSDRTLVDKAIAFEQGYLQSGDERISVEELDLSTAEDGRNGIPVTYTRDVIADLLHTDTERSHPELPVEEVLLPSDVLNAMAEGLSAAPVFSRAEAAEYENRVSVVKDQILTEQEADVLDALLAEKQVAEETVTEYVEHVFAWDSGGEIETVHGTIDPDPLVMKLFETEHLGRFSEDHYRGTTPSPAVESFRQEKVITALNRYAWENRDEGFAVEDIDLRSIPVIKAVLNTHDWDDIKRLFEDFDPRQWEDPPEGTETERLKEATIERLCGEEYGYSPASAELTTRRVMREVQHRWD
ncbi:PrkA family serine protein kinase [Halalkalirubrum salinum]|uniref:PrkA family serine protein kinase n=1 Tax=Halalkalirubrum salinum TaxID=2563889 RepID=UPI0010FB4045|nr:kinase anchor protein [Halalkalirubrum salinum]